MANKNTVGQTTSKSQNIKSKIKELVPEYKALFLYYKYYPQLLPKEYKTFEELKDSYKMFPKGVTEEQAELYLLEEPVQQALKVLLSALHSQKMVELYTIYFERAKTDTNAFKAFVDFSNTFFNNNEESELLSILNGVNIND